MKRLTDYDANGNVFACEEVRVLSTRGAIYKDDMYKIMMHLAEKLAKYEDLEEQKKLLKLPCAVGDTVYYIDRGSKEPIKPMKVYEVGALSLKEEGFVTQIMCRDKADGDEICYLGIDIGKVVFLTKEEAEQALKDMEGKRC